MTATERDFRFYLTMWGYHVSGDVREVSAMVSEQPGYSDSRVRWDKTSAGLRDSMVSTPGGGWRQVRDWVALPWVTTHISRGHAGFPGL